MSFIAGEKILGALATIGTVGVAVASSYFPTIINKYILGASIGDSGEEVEYIGTPEGTGAIDEEENYVIAPSKSSNDPEFEKIKAIRQRIVGWLEKNKSCTLRFTNSIKEGEYISLDLEKIEEKKDNPIFRNHKAIGKSKFEKLADDLENRAAQDPTYSKYLDGFRERCRRGGELTLHWRDALRESRIKDKSLLALKNLWLDEEILEVTKIQLIGG